jgi:NADH dehydrogenase
MPQKLSNYTLRRLEKMGVQVMLNALVSEVTADAVYLSDGRMVATRSTVWTAGVRGETFAEQWSLPTGPGGRVIVQPTLQVEGLEAVYAIGDMMYLQQDGAPLPMLAPVATQQGSFAARNIMRQERGEALQAFEYNDRGSMATIGRNAAVVQIGKRTFSGYFAWLMWLFVHLSNLIGFRNRLVVLINWAWNYLFYEHVGRYIFEPTAAIVQREKR